MLIQLIETVFPADPGSEDQLIIGLNSVNVSIDH
jgi:hypothetical protein